MKIIKDISIFTVIVFGLFVAPELTLPGLIAWAMYEIGKNK